MEEHPKLFISYSHDNQAHKDWVLKLATDLRAHMGVDVTFDQWDLRIGGDLSLFMEQGLSSASLVMCICSDEYVRKANAGIRGSGYEKMILTQALLNDTNTDSIIPVMRCNREKKMPTFLGTKLYIDFSNDSDYLTRLGELRDRIYNKDISKKPSLGQNPFSKVGTNAITVKTDIERAMYHSPIMSGSVSFDFNNNSGEYLVGTGDYEFNTQWSECGSQSIYAYRDKVKLIGYSPDIHEIPTNDDFSEFDFTSRARKIRVGEVIIWLNQNGKYMATKVTNVEVASRGAEKNVLSFDYRIYH
ncbi:MAG: toll/interleukin-1 receptor domain-containing protein [Candidatus Bruticola sp.]